MVMLASEAASVSSVTDDLLDFICGHQVIGGGEHQDFLQASASCLNCQLRSCQIMALDTGNAHKNARDPRHAHAATPQAQREDVHRTDCVCCLELS
jgi:hypothetical protein